MDIEHYYAESYLESANPKLGQSQPVVVYAEGDQFFVKNNIVKGKKEDASFFQELLASLLALKLGVPVPEFAIIDLDKDFLDNNPSLRFKNKFKEGRYFATKLLPGIENNLLENYVLAKQNGQPRLNRSWNSFFRNITNEVAIPRIIAFDILILNFDRFGNEGNILVSRNDTGERNIFAIDHGYAFGNPFYVDNIVEKRNLLNLNSRPKQMLSIHIDALLKNGSTGINFGPIFSGLEQNIDFSKNPFEDIVFAIENLSQSDIIEMLESIPEEWVSDGVSQKNEYLNCILRQKTLVRHIIDELACRNAFSNHRGGVLEWKDIEENFGTV